MALRFACPNGHPITCDESKSGKKAKCPQCGVKFVVPAAGKKKAAPLPKKEPVLPGGGASRDGSSSDVEVQKDKEEAIVFLCPNGHKLNGPARLQGRPGQCPECGAKFRIPSYDEMHDVEDADVVDDVEILTGEVVGDDTEFDLDELEEIGMVGDSPALAHGGVEEIEEIEEIEDIEQFPAYEEGVEYADPEAAYIPALPDFSQDGHALAGIFAFLWQQRRMGGLLEVQLTEGELLSPEFFSPELSSATHGVFAVRSKDGTFTITSVPWDSVLRVTLRKTEELPPGVFEE